MARPKEEEHGIRIAITIPKATLNWIDSEIKKGTYFNRSHAVIKMAKDQELENGR